MRLSLRWAVGLLICQYVVLCYRWLAEQLNICYYCIKMYVHFLSDWLGVSRDFQKNIKMRVV